MSGNKKTPQDVRNQGEGNFSHVTGEKINDVYSNCWVKKQPYNCGYNKCPGYKLILTNI